MCIRDRYYDEKGNFKSKDVQKFYDDLKNNGDVNQYNEWLKQRKSIEYRMMARQLFANISGGITANKKEATELLNQRDQLADVDLSLIHI